MPRPAWTIEQSAPSQANVQTTATVAEFDDRIVPDESVPKCHTASKSGCRSQLKSSSAKVQAYGSCCGRPSVPSSSTANVNDVSETISEV